VCEYNQLGELVPTHYPLRPRPIPKLLSVVVPVYNEEEVLPLFLERIRACINRWPWSTEILFVNDGSADRSIEILMDACAQDPRLKVLSLARNFGHQAAASAGLDYSRGDVTALIDADLQDPPELIETMVEHYTKGFDVVCGRRASRENETWFKRGSAWLYYRLMRWLIHPQLPVDVGDFRLISRPCLETLKSMHEVHRFLRGMVAWLGYPQATIEFVRVGRVAGSTKYPLRKMLTFAWTSALSFSPAPLRLGSMVGALLVLVGVAYGVYAIVRIWMGLSVVRGWTSLMVLICLVGGAIMFGIGIVGEYVAKIYEQVKDRPVYVVMDSLNIDTTRPQGLSNVGPDSLHEPEPGAGDP
jgi:polyisoprenyl-phosphate glycosyltransferase